MCHESLNVRRMWYVFDATGPGCESLSAKVSVGIGKKTALVPLPIAIIKPIMISLPRQARDKHSETSNKQVPFFAADCQRIADAKAANGPVRS